MTGPLAGIRVVEIAGLAPAPFGCMLLADLGADVLRIDRLGSAPTVSGPPGPLDRGRRTIAVDLKSPDAAGLVARLAASADVFVEGLRPGVAERLGIGPDVLLSVNPRLVYARMTGWGQDGPLAARAGHDIDYIALAGALEPFGTAGGPPVPPANILGDFAGGGTFLALGILAALLERGTSGVGQIVDAAMVDGASVLASFLHGMRAAGRWGGPRGTNLLDGGAPFYTTYETADGGYMAVGAIEPAFFAELVRILELDPADVGPQFDERTWSQTAAALATAFARHTREHWTTVFAASDACVAPVLSPWEAPKHPHHIARGSFVEVDGIVQPAPAPRFSRSAAPTPRSADADGRDIRDTLSDWGIDAAGIDALVERGSVG